MTQPQPFKISANSKERSDSYVHLRNEKEISEKKHLRRKVMRTIEMRREAKEAGCSVADLL